MHTESRKMVLVNLFAGKEWKRRHRDGCGHSGGRREGGEWRKWHQRMCTITSISEKLLQNAGSPAWCSGPRGWDWGGEGGETCATGEGDGRPLQHSCLESSMKRQKDRTLKDELPRSVGARYATGDQWRNGFKKNE